MRKAPVRSAFSGEASSNRGQQGEEDGAAILESEP